MSRGYAVDSLGTETQGCTHINNKWVHR